MKKTAAIVLILASALLACGLSLVLYWYCIGPNGRSAYDRSAPVPSWMLDERDLMWERYALIFGSTSAVGGAVFASLWLGCKGLFPAQTLLSLGIASLLLQSSYVFILLPALLSPALLVILRVPPKGKRMLHFALSLSYCAALFAALRVFWDDWGQYYLP